MILKKDELDVAGAWTVELPTLASMVQDNAARDKPYSQLEVEGCRFTPPEDGIETVDRDPQFWGVYGRREDGMTDHLGDFSLADYEGSHLLAEEVSRTCPKTPCVDLYAWKYASAQAAELREAIIKEKRR